MLLLLLPALQLLCFLVCNKLTTSWVTQGCQRWALAKTSTVQGVTLKAYVALTCIEAKNLKREVLGSVNLCIDINAAPWYLTSLLSLGLSAPL